MDLPDRFLAARLTPVRDALWRNGEITVAGLRRLDEALGIDTYAALEAEATERMMSETGQPRLGEIFRAAQECTGLTMPGLWESVGEKHLNGRCGCRQSTNQCDGCARGLPVRGGMHYDAQFVMPEMVCTADRYGTQAPDGSD